MVQLWWLSKDKPEKGSCYNNVDRFSLIKPGDKNPGKLTVFLSDTQLMAFYFNCSLERESLALQEHSLPATKLNLCWLFRVAATSITVLGLVYSFQTGPVEAVSWGGHSFSSNKFQSSNKCRLEHKNGQHFIKCDCSQTDMDNWLNQQSVSQPGTLSCGASGTMMTVVFERAISKCTAHCLDCILAATFVLSKSSADHFSFFFT